VSREAAPSCSLLDIERMLTATPAMAWAELQGMPDALRRWRPAPGEWSAQEIVGHLIEADMRAFLNRILLAREEPGIAFEGWDPDVVASARNDNAKDAQALMDEFAKVRAVGVSAIRELSPEDLRRAGVHPDVGALTIANLLTEWVAHDRAHLAQIGQLTRAAMLEGMGNAAEFGHAAEVRAWLAERNLSS